MKKTRLIALILCVVMLLTALTGCGKKTVMTVNGVNIPEGIYTYYYSYLYASYMSSGIEPEQVTEMTLSQILQHVAIYDLAEELGIELTALENKEIIDNRNASIEEMGRAVYASMLQAMNLTEKQYEEIDKSYYLYSKIADHYYGENGTEVPTEAEMLEHYKSSYVRATHILLSTQEAESDEERAEIKKTAEDVLARAKAGEDFYDLIREYGEDPGVAETPETGYYFTTGQMVAEFETAAFALAENEISDLVETSYGYHIILRLPMEEEYIRSTVATDEYRTTYCSMLLADKLTERMTGYEVELTDDAGTLDFSEALMFWMGY